MRTAAARVRFAWKVRTQTLRSGRDGKSPKLGNLAGRFKGYLASLHVPPGRAPETLGRSLHLLASQWPTLPDATNARPCWPKGQHRRRREPADQLNQSAVLRSPRTLEPGPPVEDAEQTLRQQQPQASVGAFGSGRR